MTLLPLAAALLFAAQATEPYAWPLDLPRKLTSSFGEYRVGRFHTGIDLRTGPIGQNVRAAADGYVYRVRCSPYGYGKAIYLRLQDGRTAVYAHLDDYAPALRDYVRKAQHRAKRYAVDLYPPENAFEFKRGELIAKSGQTGIGAPHLHYEIRGPSGNPINPRLAGVSWPDHTPPRIRKVLVVPARPETVLDGDLLPVVLHAQRTAAGQYRTRALKVHGPLRFAIDVYDPANGGASRLGVYSVRTTHHGNEIFRVLHDRLSFQNNQDGLVAYHPYLLGKGHFLLQWRWPANASEFFAQSEGPGQFLPEEDSTEIIIEVQDFAGNKSSVLIPLEPGPQRLPSNGPSQSPAGRKGEKTKGEITIETFGDWLVLSATFEKPENSFPTLHVQGRPQQQRAFQRVSTRVFRSYYEPGPQEREVTFNVRHPRIDSTDHHFFVAHRGLENQEARIEGVHIQVGSQSPYGTAFIAVIKEELSPTNELRPLGPAYRIASGNVPFDEPLRLTFPFQASEPKPEKVAVYLREGTKWTPLQTSRSGEALRVQTRNLGVFAIMEDMAPPKLWNIKPKNGATFKTRTPAISARLKDEGSGIENYRVTCNGQWLLMAYDPERQLIQWEGDRDLPPGEAELVFEATDAAGNRTRRKVSIQIGRGASPRTLSRLPRTDYYAGQ